MLVFEWDDFKDQANRHKHGISFEFAKEVFSDPEALILQDRVVEGEARWQAIGRAGWHTVLVVAHVLRMLEHEEVIRIISARHALTHERHRYESQTH